MSPQEVGKAVCAAIDDFAREQPSNAEWENLRRRLFVWFRSLDNPTALEGMLWVFEHSDKYQHQQMAGELLRHHHTPLVIPLDTFIRRIAPKLNASSNHIVKYLQEEAGVEDVRQIVEFLMQSSINQPLVTGLKNLEYWLGINRST